MKAGDAVTVNADRSTRNGQSGSVVHFDWIENSVSVKFDIDGAVIEYSPHHLRKARGSGDV